MGCKALELAVHVPGSVQNHVDVALGAMDSGGHGGGAGLGSDLLLLKVFSSLNDSGIPWFCDFLCKTNQNPPKNPIFKQLWPSCFLSFPNSSWSISTELWGRLWCLWTFPFVFSVPTSGIFPDFLQQFPAGIFWAEAWITLGMPLEWGRDLGMQDCPVLLPQPRSHPERLFTPHWRFFIH